MTKSKAAKDAVDQVAEEVAELEAIGEQLQAKIHQLDPDAPEVGATRLVLAPAGTTGKWDWRVEEYSERRGWRCGSLDIFENRREGTCRTYRRALRKGAKSLFEVREFRFIEGVAEATRAAGRQELS